MLLRSKETSPLQDSELIERYRNSHDTQYVGILFNRYAHLVFAVCMKYLKDASEAEDFSMQVFEQLIQKLRKHEVENFRGWLHQVTKNHCLMHLRKLKSQNAKTSEIQHLYAEDVETTPLAHLDVESSNGLEKRVSRLREGLERLNEHQKVCIELFYLQRKSYQEVSDQTGFDLKKVKSYIQNGKRNLHIYLTRDE
jgi:RNA polymerase sigma-70 factor (ECF subfamily)